MKQQDQDLLRDISHFISVSADHLPNDLRTYALALQVRTSLAIAGMSFDQLMNSQIMNSQTIIRPEEVEFYEEVSEGPI